MSDEPPGSKSCRNSSKLLIAVPMTGASRVLLADDEVVGLRRARQRRPLRLDRRAELGQWVVMLAHVAPPSARPVI